MTDDIVARLRKFADYRATSDDLSRALWEAADLIEQQAASLAAKDGAIRLLDERCAQYERRAEQAERALAEAVKGVESLLLSLSNNSSGRVKAARQFVKEHSTNADQ